jgi:hypothetical protein
MKSLSLAAAAAIGLSLIATSGQAGSAQTPSAQRMATPTHHSDLSAARKKPTKTYVYVRRKGYVTDSRSPYYLRPGVSPSFGYIGPPGYAGEYAWRRSIGQCVEDLGYGRWAACGWR